MVLLTVARTVVTVVARPERREAGDPLQSLIVRELFPHLSDQRRYGDTGAAVAEPAERIAP